ncbi:hypothetical protein J6590_082806 [Homalodisca vitripennis]|nr:hypothetical protein J6590_082806 [Homalodisca vitripennis]
MAKRRPALYQPIQSKRAECNVRKVFICVTFISQAILILLAVHINSVNVTIVCLVLALGLSAFSWAGFSCKKSKKILFFLNLVDSILEEVYSSKFLGILLDRGLTWNNHIDHVCAKLSSEIYVLRSLARYCPSQVCVTYTGMRLEAEITTVLKDRTVVYEHLPSQAGVHFINSLPNCITNAQTPKASKAHLKRFLVSNAFYSVDEFLAFNWETAQFDD